MKKINDLELKQLAESLLFEHNVNEMFQPDHYEKSFSRYGAYDRPADKIDGKGNNIEAFIELPLAPTDLMVNHITTVTVSPESLNDDNYCPANSTELMRAINSMIKNKMEDLNLNQKSIEVIWKLNRKWYNKL